MAKLTIGMLGAGEMGAGLASAFTRSGHRVASDLSGRSGETLARAEEAGIEAAGSLLEVVDASDILFSVLPTEYAEPVAREVALLMGDTNRAPVFVEANAIAPGLVAEIAAFFETSGAAFVDAGIIGMPPSESGQPRLYACGGDLALLRALDGAGFDLRELEGPVGAASAFKMTYAAMTKGTNALLTNVMLAAHRHGFLDAFLQEAESSQPQLAGRAVGNIPRLPCDAGRWEDEMRQIARSFDDIGLTGDFHRGAEDIMARLAASPFGSETRRTLDRSRGLEATLKGIAAGSGGRKG